MLNGTWITLIPLALTILGIYAFFSIALDIRVIRRLLERQDADRDARVP
jgi:hypothetical protein